MRKGVWEWLRGVLGSASTGEGEPRMWRFEIKGGRNEIGVLNDAVELLGQKIDIPESVVRPMQVALDELLTNCISYAPISATSPAVVDLLANDTALRAVIRYRDKPFDPLARAAPDTEAELAEREIGGLGIHLVKELMDEFTHRYEDGYNILVIGKRRP